MRTRLEKLEFAAAGQQLAGTLLAPATVLPGYACAMFRGDVLIVESEHDTLVPHAVIDNYLTAFVKPRSRTARVIAGSDHALTEDKHQRDYTALLINWLTEMIVGARADEAAKTTGRTAQAA